MVCGCRRYGLLSWFLGDRRFVLNEYKSGLEFSRRFVLLEARMYISRDFFVYILPVVQSKVLCTSQVAEQVINTVPMPSCGLLVVSGGAISCKRDIWPCMSREVCERSDCWEIFGSIHYLLLLRAGSAGIILTATPPDHRYGQLVDLVQLKEFEELMGVSLLME